MHRFRTHNCGELNKRFEGKQAKLSGWIHRKRDHGHLFFIDLRDNYGVTQILLDDTKAELIEVAKRIKNESVITVTGRVQSRSADTINDNIQTGQIELLANNIDIESEAQPLPFPVNLDSQEPEDIRLRYRFLDLRREKLHNNILLRSNVITYLREQMIKQDFVEFQTPILTGSSPEGARDFLVPSRLHKGKFYALPQAPQQFKQLLMVAGFDKYFQIAPCFRDEDLRSDRAAEFYQLDIEMSFVTQDDIFASIEPVMYHTFKKFSSKTVSPYPFQRITYNDSMLKYGSDKPDLRNPLIISDVTGIFQESGFTIFRENVKKGMKVRAIPAPKTSSKPRSFFDNMIDFAIAEGARGLGYIIFDENCVAKGPIAKFLDDTRIKKIQDLCNLNAGDAVFFSSDVEMKAANIAGKVRDRLGSLLDLINKDKFEFCWIVDFPYFAYNDEKKSIDFFHNPFSMPQGGGKALEDARSQEDLLTIKAYQYDIVCNGIELCSGAIRNHKPEIMYKAFAIAGYKKEDVDTSFSALITAFKYGAPAHGGLAPGIDRMVMLLADEKNIREVSAFPFNQQAEDLMMKTPATISKKHMNELGLEHSIKVKKMLNERNEKNE